MSGPGDQLGPYRLLHLIGSGGMGQVFAAVHERMNQQVAIKLLSPAAAADPQLVARFIQEARALAQLQHPGVVRVLHCDRLEDGTAFLAMERLEGLSLREWMWRQQGPTPKEAALAVCRQIADVMVDIHARGVVHRDLKPENVFLCPDASLVPGYRVKLLDFGIAKVPPAREDAHRDTQVQTGAPAFLGTAAYMAPEQCRNAAKVDGCADVYALGVVLFELLAGRPPFVSEEPIELISMHVRAEPPSLHEVVPGIPGALSAFVASMLAKEPAARPTVVRCRDMLGRTWESEQDECPVPGLAPFTEAQAELFFGRKAEIDELVGLLENGPQGRRWVQVEGPSGIGKSSLIQAGLLPRLKEHSSQGASRWRIAVMRPSYDPLPSLARALVAALAGADFAASANEVEQLLQSNSGALGALVRARTPPGHFLLLVIEQVEELFTLGAAGGSRMDELLSTALTVSDVPLRLITTLRSDFLHRLEQLPLLARELNQAARYHLRPMDEEALAQVIQGMAQRLGLRLSEGLPMRMVRDVTSEGSRLPLLGQALRALWSLRSGTLLTHESYEQIGGVGGALAQQAERLLDGMGAEGRERAKRILLDLVQIGRGVPDTRRPRTKQEVLAAGGGDGLALEVLMRLSGMRTAAKHEAEEGLRLVVLSISASEPFEQRVDLIHETLIQQVPSFAGWLDRERALLEREADLEVAAQAWERAGCPAEGLPAGSLLAHYGGLSGTAGPESLPRRMVSARAARFLSVAQRLDRRRGWAGRGLILAALVAGAAIAFSALRAFRERRHAEENLQRVVSTTEQFVSDMDWKLSRFANTLDVRRRMLRQFDENLASLPEQERGTSEVRNAIIDTKHRLSDLAFFDDSLGRTEGFLNAALAEIRPGLELQPQNRALALRLALNHSKRGKVALARGRLDEARHHFSEALAFLRRPPAQVDDDYRRTLATSYAEEAELELALGSAEAARLYDRALQLLEENARGGEDYDRALLADVLCLRAEASHHAGDLGAATGYLDRASRLVHALTGSSPGNAFFRWILARIQVELASVHLAQGRLVAADAEYRDAQKLGRMLHDGEPTNKRYALVLARSLAEHENAANSYGENEQVRLLHHERCALVDDFVGMDVEDVRFRNLACR